MSDRVLIALPDGRWLALSAEALEAALLAGAQAPRKRRTARSVAPMSSLS